MTSRGSTKTLATNESPAPTRAWRAVVCGLVLAGFLTGCTTVGNDHADGLRLLEARRLQEAWQAFERGYEKDPVSPFSLNNMGYVLEMRDGDLIRAAGFYRRAIGACAERRGDPGLDRLERIANENLARVLWKIQTTPRLHVNVRDPGIRTRAG